jgi:sulfatase maturation enzyme AslB (radical SAM superfamily)
VNEPVPAYVHAKRKTINFPKNDQDLVTYLQNQGIDYIVIAPLLQSPRNTELSKDVNEAQSEMETMPDLFQLVFENAGNNVRVYQYLGK